MKTYLHVELLQFFLLARSSQLYERCNPVNTFNGSPGGTEVNQTESPENFVVIFEILPTDKKWKSNEITHCRSWASCGFNDRTATLQVGFFPTSTTLELELFNCVLFHRTKFEFFFFSFSQSKCLRLFELLLTRFSSEVDVVRRSCPSQVTELTIYWSGFLSSGSIFDVRMNFFR